MEVEACGSPKPTTQSLFCSFSFFLLFSPHLCLSIDATAVEGKDLFSLGSLFFSPYHDASLLRGIFKRKVNCQISLSVAFLQPCLCGIQVFTITTLIIYQDWTICHFIHLIRLVSNFMDFFFHTYESEIIKNVFLFKIN